MARIEVLNPFEAACTVTSSSAQGHHVPYGGTMSCDMDVDVPSRGAPVTLRVRTNGPPLRGRVESVRPACASKRIEDGGSVVVVALERVTGEPTGLRVAFAHLDPVTVAIGDTIEVDGAPLGALGPEVAQDWGPEAGLSRHMHGAEEPQRAEYHSSCAQHSHLHLEGFGADSVMRARSRPGLDDPLLSFTTGGEVAEPDVAGGAGSFRTSDIAAVTVAAATVAPSPGTYEVQAGETLLEIAAKLGLPLAALVAENPDLVEAGETLTVPGQVYVVRPRDTLAEIAARLGVGLAQLIEVNGIANPNLIEVGQVLTIPR
jgi:LysM repeat protein